MPTNAGTVHGDEETVEPLSIKHPVRLSIAWATVIMRTERIRGRFAPSPSGPLHFGSLVAALGSFLHARSRDGIWLVRIEDIDPLREQAGATDGILSTLAAFGMTSDEPVWKQSERRDRYRSVRDHLNALGHAYPCRCSRRQLQIAGGLHPSRCLPPEDESRPPAWRLRVPNQTIEFDDAICGPQAQNVASAVGDFVIWRSDDWPAYQLACVVDDAEQGITDVVRGADLLDTTPRQIVLQTMLALPTPRYAHLPLVLDAAGRKLSKSDAARPVDVDNPLPTLRAALTILNQDPAIGGHTVEQLLRSAIAHFESGRIPATNTRLIAAQDEQDS